MSTSKRHHVWECVILFSAPEVYVVQESSRKGEMLLILWGLTLTTTLVASTGATTCCTRTQGYWGNSPAGTGAWQNDPAIYGRPFAGCTGLTWLEAFQWGETTTNGGQGGGQGLANGAMHARQYVAGMLSMELLQNAPPNTTCSSGEVANSLAAMINTSEDYFKNKRQCNLSTSWFDEDEEDAKNRWDNFNNGNENSGHECLTPEFSFPHVDHECDGVGTPANCTEEDDEDDDECTAVQHCTVLSLRACLGSVCVENMCELFDLLPVFTQTDLGNCTCSGSTNGCRDVQICCDEEAPVDALVAALNTTQTFFLHHGEASPREDVCLDDQESVSTMPGDTEGVVVSGGTTGWNTGVFGFMTGLLRALTD